METLYRKVEIKSEQDLPKEEGTYDVYTVTNSFRHKRFSPQDKASVAFWKQMVNYYYQPVEPQESKQGAEEIINGLGNIITGIQSDIDFNEKVNLGLVMDGLTVILDQVEEYAQNQQPEISVTDEEIEIQANLHFEENTSDNAIWRGGAKWLRDKLKTNLKDELIKFAQQFYADEETCIHNVNKYLKSKQP